jgi:hypothetical protein
VLRASELVVLGYLAYVLLLAWVRPIGRRRRAVVVVVVLITAAAAWSLVSAQQPPLSVVRDWIPGLYLLVGYWLSGAFYLRPSPRFEAWLAAWDARVFDRWGLSMVVRRLPRVALECLELAYLSVYAMVPVGFALVYGWGSRESNEVDAYWTVVLVTGYICYGLLAWLPSRPPIDRALYVDIDTRKVATRRVNLGLRRAASVRASTFPSGHVATAVAVALAAGAVVPGARIPLLVVAAGITTASVLGRYHYAVDAILGVGLALCVWGVVTL